MEKQKQLDKLYKVIPIELREVVSKIVELEIELERMSNRWEGWIHIQKKNLKKKR